MTVPRAEYPRPQFVRDEWQNLNGEWEFAFDDDQEGLEGKWYRGDKSFPMLIQVPFCYQSRLSGIGVREHHETIWYRRTVSLDTDVRNNRVILHFGAIDYESRIWVNGELAAAHIGGHTPVSADITHHVCPGENVIVLRAGDSQSLTQPRGKQYWKDESEAIFYTPTSGIWQTVWLETVPNCSLSKVRLTPDTENREIEIQTLVNGLMPNRETMLAISISFNGTPICEDRIKVHEAEMTRRIKLRNFNENCAWSPENPNLYDVEFELSVSGTPTDRVRSYFGMRNMTVKNGELYLNKYPYQLRMVLDQGYFPDGLLTPPTDEAIRQDVELTKSMGFNGARKHQKIEDPRYLYWCDKLGLLVWGEMPSAFEFSESYVRSFVGEWMEAVDRDYNHPCIVAWVPLNESWGMPELRCNSHQQQHSASLYHLTKSLDGTRLVMSNDGWEHTISDLCTIHDYEWREEVLRERYGDLMHVFATNYTGRSIYVDGYSHNGQPVLVTEFGGISFEADEKGWGYSSARSKDDFLDRLQAVCKPLQDARLVQGYCYTQLTDVEQEQNGLLTYDRKPKADLDAIRRIIEGK